MAAKKDGDEYVYIRVDVEWDLDGLEGEVDPDEYVKDAGLPPTVFIKVPRRIYESDAELNLSGQIEDRFSTSVDDIFPGQVSERASRNWLLWTRDRGLLDEGEAAMLQKGGR